MQEDCLQAGPHGVAVPNGNGVGLEHTQSGRHAFDHPNLPEGTSHHFLDLEYAGMPFVHIEPVLQQEPGAAAVQGGPHIFNPHEPWLYSANVHQHDLNGLSQQMWGDYFGPSV